MEIRTEEKDNDHTGSWVGKEKDRKEHWAFGFLVTVRKMVRIRSTTSRQYRTNRIGPKGRIYVVTSILILHLNYRYMNSRSR